MSEQAMTSALQALTTTTTTQQVPQEKGLEIDADKTGTPAAPPRAEEKAPDPLSSRFAALARKEKQLVQQQAEWKKEQETMRQEMERIKAEIAKRETEDPRKIATQNPLKALEYLGLSYNDLTNFILKGEQPTPELEVKAVRQELQSFKDQLTEQRKKEEKERQKQSEELRQAEEKKLAEVIEKFKSVEIPGFVEQNKEKYELCAINEAAPLIYDVIETHYEKEKKVLSLDEACGVVEKFLEEQIRKNLSTKKLQAKAETQPQGSLKQSEKSEQRTLTNNMSSSAPSMLPAKTENDRMARAMAALTR